MRKLSDITKISELFEIVDWNFDGAGLVVTDGQELARKMKDMFPDLEWDMTFPYNEEDK